MICHFLIGIPGSGKSTFSQYLATLTQGETISTDAIRANLYGDETIQGNWEEIEAEVIHQITKAIEQEKTVIYDATNAKRAWRMGILQKLGIEAKLQRINWMAWYLNPPLVTCQQRNQNRQRNVPESIINKMTQSLKEFPPIPAEGFIAVEILNEENWDLAKIQAIIDKLPRRIINRQNRTQHSNSSFHAYSRLLDFERLMHLLSLMIQYPGLGNLSNEQLQKIFEDIPDFVDEIAQISAVMAKLRGEIYGEREAIANDLNWLASQGIIHQGKLSLSETINLPQIKVETQEYSQINVHTYSEIESFERLITIIRFILIHPFLPFDETSLEDTPKKPLDVLANFLSQQPGIIGDCKDILRKDIERILKPYQILPSFPLRRGYFAGTAIFSATELRQIFQLLQSQAKTLDDPLALKTYESFKQRMGWSRLGEEEIYPIRRIANRSMIDTDILHPTVLAKNLDVLESVIEEGELIEMTRLAKRGEFLGDQESTFEAWLLQIVFYNFAWYVGLEIKESGLLRFERLDRLSINRRTQKKRGRQAQQKALNKLEQLLDACPGIHLGYNPREQRQYLSSVAKERKAVEVTLEFWCNEHIFRFISEGTKRFRTKQMKMSPPIDGRKYEQKTLFCLPPSEDPNFPHRFQVTFPKWSLDDVDLWRWLVGFGHQIKIIKPQKLKEDLLQFVREIQEIY